MTAPSNAAAGPARGRVAWAEVISRDVCLTIGSVPLGASVATWLGPPDQTSRSGSPGSRAARPGVSSSAVTGVVADVASSASPDKRRGHVHRSRGVPATRLGGRPTCIALIGGACTTAGSGARP